MSTDRGLLELAAKAAGLNVEWHWGCGDALAYVDKNASARLFWNPLTDDGDALRLAVKLGMVLNVRYTDPVALRFNEVCYWPRGQESSPWKRLQFDDIETDMQAATRRAITRAAAEIGRGMA